MWSKTSDSSCCDSRSSSDSSTKLLDWWRRYSKRPECAQKTWKFRHLLLIKSKGPCIPEPRSPPPDRPPSLISSFFLFYSPPLSSFKKEGKSACFWSRAEEQYTESQVRPPDIPENWKYPQTHTDGETPSQHWGEGLDRGVGGQLTMRGEWGGGGGRGVWWRGSD